MPGDSDGDDGRLLVDPSKIETVPLDELKPHPANARVHNVAAIADSLSTFGVYQPLVVQRSTGYVVVGNGRLEAARELGWSYMSALVLDVDADTARAILLADNRTSDLASYDPAALVALLEAVPAFDGTGYSEQDLADLRYKLETPDEFPLVEADDDFDLVCPRCGFLFNDERETR